MLGIAIIIELLASVSCLFKAVSIAKKDKQATAVKVNFIGGICLILFGIVMAIWGHSQGFLFDNLPTISFSVRKLLIGGLCGLIICVMGCLILLFDRENLKENKKTYITLAVVITLLVSLLSGFGVFDTKSNKDTDHYGHDSSDVRVIVQNIVKDNLKAPATAEFGDCNVNCSGSTWTVTGYVDAQNSFGATLRNKFTVVITFTSDTSYTINQCSIVAN